jgi:hypothetical protein
MLRIAPERPLIYSGHAVIRRAHDPFRDQHDRPPSPQPCCGMGDRSRLEITLPPD